MSRWIDIDDDRNCYIGTHGEYERWNIDPEVLAEAESTGPKRDDENEIKFFYVESIDDYWIGGVRIDNFYYADWHKGLGFVWSKSKYLPWGEHIVDEETLWKEHTYPSEPKEMPFTEWIRGFVKKYFTGADMKGAGDGR